MSEKTSVNSGHLHTYEVDEDGNGWTSLYGLENEISHKHPIINWEIQTEQSLCYPDCFKKYKKDGIGPHVHELNGKKINIYESGDNPVVKKEKPSKRNKSTITHKKTILRNQWPFSYKKGMKIDKDIKVDEH